MGLASRTAPRAKRGARDVALALALGLTPGWVGCADKGAGDAAPPRRSGTATESKSERGAAQPRGLEVVSADSYGGVATPEPRPASPAPVRESFFASSPAPVPAPSEAKPSSPRFGEKVGGLPSEPAMLLSKGPNPSDLAISSPPAKLDADRGRTESEQLADRAEPARRDLSSEAYARIVDNAFLKADQAPLSTFSIDVDTASYANVRRFVSSGMLPPKDAVRIEEMVNYFPYNYPPPTGDNAFAADVEIGRCPWNGDHRLARIALKGKVIQSEKRPTSNLVFLLDVSGSMNQPNKLPLLKSAMKLLLDQLGENDRVAIVVYAGAEGLALPSTSCDQKRAILAAIENLAAGGSTNGGAGITLAYETAVRNFIPGGTNRVILCTDGDFNVGITSQAALMDLIVAKAKSKVFLSVLGFGEGNLKDSTMEALADKGNGNYAYIDGLREARKVLVEGLSGTLVTIAKDVKIQVEFNPAKVAAYRLIGYENRVLAARDFDDDKKDAGEIGAGHTVTALYELVPVGKEVGGPDGIPLKYASPTAPKPAADPAPGANSPESLTVKIRFKAPEGDVSKKIEQGFVDPGTDSPRGSDDFQFAAAVASFGMILRDSPYKGTSTINTVLELGETGLGSDTEGHRKEFLDMARAARPLLDRR